MTAGLACERPARPNKLPGVVIGADESDGSRHASRLIQAWSRQTLVIKISA